MQIKLHDSMKIPTKTIVSSHAPIGVSDVLFTKFLW